MRLLYRADGGHPIGTGHLFRAQRILRQLRHLYQPGQLDATLAYASDPSARTIAKHSPARLVELRPRTDPDAIKPFFRFESIRDIVADTRPDVILVDMLDTAAEEMGPAASTGVPIITFDDRGPGRSCAEAIINILVEEPHPSALPSTARLFEGPAYAVLDPVYAQENGAWRWRESSGRVLVTLGGGDAAGLAVKVANSISRSPVVNRVDFCIGPAFPSRDELEAAAKSARWTSQIHTGLPSLLERYLDCDLALVAGGLTMFEVCCVGVPAAAICQPIDHQLELADRLKASGAMESVGDGSQASTDQIPSAVERLLGDDELRHRMSRIGPNLVDGRGVERVAAAIMQFAGRPLSGC